MRGGPRAGFTLLEVVVTLVVAVILGTLMFQVLGANLTNSPEPLHRAEDSHDLEGIMALMTSHYLEALAADPDGGLDTFKGYAENGNNVGNDRYYGEYDVTTSYIVIDETTGYVETDDASGDNRVLKVTIKRSRNGVVQSLTALFTK